MNWNNTDRNKRRKEQEEREKEREIERKKKSAIRIFKSPHKFDFHCISLLKSSAKLKRLDLLVAFMRRDNNNNKTKEKGGNNSSWRLKSRTLKQFQIINFIPKTKEKTNEGIAYSMCKSTKFLSFTIQKEIY